jgi:hypothetical protein
LQIVTVRQRTAATPQYADVLFAWAAYSDMFFQFAAAKPPQTEKRKKTYVNG